MKRFISLAFVMMFGMATIASKADLDKGRQIVTTACASCYTAGDNSGIVMYPRPSTQHAIYVYDQTKATKEGKRTTGASGVMESIMMNLSEQDMHSVVAYYNKQQSKSGETSPKKGPELGVKIYRGGIADKKVPACMSCHGPSRTGVPGGGTDIATYPRLGG